MDDAIKAQIIAKLDELVIDLAPDATLRSMYGGTVIELAKKDDPRSRIGGFYVYPSYVSFEFAKGVSFDDPDHILEGAGKHRRHVKIRAFEDVQAKRCKAFLQQALVI